MEEETAATIEAEVEGFDGAVGFVDGVDQAASGVGGTAADTDDAGVVSGGSETLHASEEAEGVAEAAEQTSSGDHGGAPPAGEQGWGGGGERGEDDRSLTVMMLPVERGTLVAERGGKGVGAVIGVVVAAMYYAMWAAITIALG